MSQLRVIPNGALLIRNGLIEEVGPTRRVENLAAAKNAREIDASGRVIMPGFTDPDVFLVVPPRISRQPADSAADDAGVRAMSRRNVEIRAGVAALERARYGCIAAGSHTGRIVDLKTTVKVLRAYRALQGKPLRIRSIFSCDPVPLDDLIASWFPAIRKEKLATVIDLTLEDIQHKEDNGRTDVIVATATAATGAGFALRLRSAHRLGAPGLKLALSGGAISIVAPLDALPAFTGPLADIGCVRVIPSSEAFDNPGIAACNVRAAIDGGAAIALSSTFRSQQMSSFNMQFLLYLAVRHLAMTAEEAITATTYNAACSIRMSHVTGSLSPGKSADLIMMDVPDYRDLPRRAGHHDVTLVMRAGVIVARRSTPLILD